MQTQTLIHNPTLERLIQLHQNDRLAHAYLFVGASQVGKAQTAFALAKLINCENSTTTFCDQCPSCLKINSGNHPDVHVIESPSGEPIKIETIRELLDQVKLRPFLSTKKIFILRRIENLTLEGANCLLKTLEEPSGNTLLFLTTSVPEQCLDTIKSRCHRVYFPLLPQATLRERLKKETAVLSVQVVMDQFIFNHNTDTFVKEVLAENEKTKVFLDILLCWVRDAILIKAGVTDERLIHLNRFNDLRAFVQPFSFAQLQALSDEVVHMTELFDENLNLKIPVMLIKEKLNAAVV